jgi:hypothetical protein
MLRSIPPRLRAPVIMFTGGSVITVVTGIAYGWGSFLSIGLITIAATVGYFIVAGHDSDFAAMLRDQADERQSYRRLQMQALVGRITTLAAAIAYVAAFAAKITLWPFAIFLGVPGLTYLVGWLVYWERGDRPQHQPGH